MLQHSLSSCFKNPVGVAERSLEVLVSVSYVSLSEQRYPLSELLYIYSLDQVPSNFMNVERSCDVAKYARLTEPGAVAGSGQLVVVRMSHHGVP